jgi:hypothetical protein
LNNFSTLKENLNDFESASTKVLELSKQRLKSHSSPDLHKNEVLILEWMQGMFDFRFIKDIQLLAESENVVDALHEKTDVGLCEEYGFALQALTKGTDDISTTAATVPPLSFRQLARMSSDPDEDAAAKKEALLAERKACCPESFVVGPHGANKSTRF